MSKKRPRKLVFSKPVIDMTTTARNFLAHGRNYMSYFTLADPELDADWFNSFEFAIQDVEDSKDPQSAIADRKVIKDVLDEKFNESIKEYTEAIYYVRKLHPNSQSHLDTYGYKLFKKARNSPKLMRDVMNQAMEQMEDEKTDLIDKGYLQTKIDAFGLLYASLCNAIDSYNSKAGANEVLTDEFYEKANKVWLMKKQLNAAAEIAFDDETRRDLFKLYPEHTHTDYAFTQDVPANGVVALHRFNLTFKPEQELEFKVVSGSGTLTVCMVSAEGELCGGNAKTINNSGDYTFTYADFGGSGQYLRFTQDGTTDMKVRIILPAL